MAHIVLVEAGVGHRRRYVPGGRRGGGAAPGRSVDELGWGPARSPARTSTTGTAC
jgi:hypothetical protein